jgi:hypothetical protein
MKVLISGSKDFDDPLVFRRAMGVVMSDLNDSELVLLLAGSYKTNELARQFVNLTESSFSSRGMKINYRHVPPTDIPWHEVDMVVCLVKPPKSNTALGYEAESMNKDVHVFRY